MGQVDREVRAALVAQLRARRAAGELSIQVVRRAAEAIGVRERAVWRWLAQEDQKRRPRAGRYRLTEQDREDYLAWRGNVAGVWRARCEAGEPGLPSLRTFQETFARELSPAERAAARDGVDGRRRHEVYLRWAPERRNAVWESDHKELPVLVIAPRGQRPRKPWVTLFIDAYSRLVMGWALSLTPSSATVLAALRMGLVVDLDRGPFGGVPDVVRPDGGLEFAAKALDRAAGVLGFTLAPTPPYSPHAKGKVERLNRTLDQEFAAGLPFFTQGPRAADGRLLGPDAEPMGLELFAARFADWIREYNTSRPHSGLDGQTPLERWLDDASPIRQVPAEELRWLLLADEERTVNKDGIHFKGLVFIAPELNGLVGERVQVRYTPHDYRQIEVFRGDEHLATARPHDLLTPEERQAVLARRRDDARELGRRQRRASRRARAKLAPITSTGPIEDTTTITAGQARAERRRRRDVDLRELARTDLLDLKSDFAYWNPPKEQADTQQDRHRRDETEA